MNSNPYPGKLMVYEGIGGSGKSTQVEKSVYYLRGKLGVDMVQVYREPGGTELGEKMRSVLRSPDLEGKICGTANAFLFNGARVQLIHQEVRPALKAGKIVILDRFYDSTKAYQAAEGADRKLLNQVCALAVGDCIPDMVMYFDLPLKMALDRRATDGVADDKFDQRQIEYHRTLKSEYDRLAKESNMTVIDASKSIDQVFEQVRKHLDRL